MQREAGRLADSLLSYVSIHTTAYVWLSPYGWSDDFSCNDPDDLDDIVRFNFDSLFNVYSGQAETGITLKNCEYFLVRVFGSWFFDWKNSFHSNK